jgi:hypothetical protein
MSDNLDTPLFPATSSSSPSLAIACASGGFKSVFVHGVLSELAMAGVQADAYAAASSSVFPAICAAIGQADEIGLRYWRGALHTLKQPGNGMSEVVLQSIADSSHLLHQHLFQPGVTAVGLTNISHPPSSTPPQPMANSGSRLRTLTKSSMPPLVCCTPGQFQRR